MNLLEVVIESDRLIQIPISIENIDDIFASFTSEVATYMYPQPSGDINITRRFIETSVKNLKLGTNLQLVILDKKTNEFLGCSGLHNLDRTDPELGIWLKKAAHGNGYGFEAVKGVINWAENNVNYEYLKYPVDKKNYASKRIPERLGGRVFKEYKTKNMIGNELNILEYRLK